LKMALIIIIIIIFFVKVKTLLSGFEW
jgi:hypothetical protein